MRSTRKQRGGEREGTTSVLAQIEEERELAKATPEQKEKCVRKPEDAEIDLGGRRRRERRSAHTVFVQEEPKE